MSEPKRAGFCEVMPDGIRLQYAACYPCQFGQCPGGIHGWADLDDVEHAADTGQLDPSGQKCGCTCADGPLLAPEPMEPDWDQVSIDATPCPVCGSDAACGYDGEGRALIHSLGSGDEEDS